MKKEYKYDLESLVNLFKDHAEKAAMHNTKLIKEFMQNFPGEPVPEHFYETFSLPVALAAICEAILELQKQPKKD